MTETKHDEPGTGNEPAKRRGWRNDEFARHEVLIQIWMFGPWFIIIAIFVAMLLLRACAAPSTTSD